MGVTLREEGDNRWAVVIVYMHECSGMCRTFLAAESKCLQMLCFYEIRKKVFRKVSRIKDRMENMIFTKQCHGNP